MPIAALTLSKLCPEAIWSESAQRIDAETENLAESIRIANAWCTHKGEEALSEELNTLSAYGIAAHLVINSIWLAKADSMRTTAAHRNKPSVLAIATDEEIKEIAGLDRTGILRPHGEQGIHPAVAIMNHTVRPSVARIMYYTNVGTLQSNILKA